MGDLFKPHANPTKQILKSWFYRYRSRHTEGPRSQSSKRVQQRFEPRHPVLRAHVLNTIPQTER